jgi:hypothetical protein
MTETDNAMTPFVEADIREYHAALIRQILAVDMCKPATVPRRCSTQWKCATEQGKQKSTSRGRLNGLLYRLNGLLYRGRQCDPTVWRRRSQLRQFFSD